MGDLVFVFKEIGFEIRVRLKEIQGLNPEVGEVSSELWCFDDSLGFSMISSWWIDFVGYGHGGIPKCKFINLDIK